MCRGVRQFGVKWVGVGRAGEDRVGGDGWGVFGWRGWRPIGLGDVCVEDGEHVVECCEIKCCGVSTKNNMSMTWALMQSKTRTRREESPSSA